MFTLCICVHILTLVARTFLHVENALDKSPSNNKFALSTALLIENQKYNLYYNKPFQQTWGFLYGEL